MEYSRSNPRKAWACYLNGDAENKLDELEKLFPMVQFVLEESAKLIVSNTGVELLDSQVENTIIEMGGIRV